MAQKIYKNSTEVTNVHGVPFYLEDIVQACLTGRLNLFLQGDTGSGKTQLARDAMSYFGDKSMFLLGRNDMDTRELFRQINLEKLRGAKSTSEIKEITDKVDSHLVVVDELPNACSAVRAQLFNLFDGFIELDGKAYPIGNGYSVGIATGNIGQKFTESSNELGRALKDRMHVIVDVDYFSPTPSDTLEILSGSTNPRVEFEFSYKDASKGIIQKHHEIKDKEIPLDKILLANYLLHGLDYSGKGSKRKMKDAWPTELDAREQVSDIGLVLPVSVRAAKSITRLSQSLDEIAKEKGATSLDTFDSMMAAYKLVAAYSGVLNEAAVQEKYAGDRYKAIDQVILATKGEFDRNSQNIAAGLEMAYSGKTDERILNKFQDRWAFMQDTLRHLAEYAKTQKEK